MKLQHKAWVLVLVIAGLSAVGAMLGTRLIVGASFERLEHERAEREGERARRLLQQQLASLATTAKDYAYWADAVEFLAGRRPRFLADNFAPDSMGYLRIAEVLLLDARGELVSSVALDGRGGLVPVEPARRDALRQFARPVLEAGAGHEPLAGLRVSGGRLEAVVAAPVRHTDGSTPAAQGALVMLRHFDRAEIARFSELLMTPVRLSMVAPGHAPEDFHVAPADQAHNDLHAVLKDQRGQPVAELVLRLDRELQRHAQLLSWQGMGLAALASLLAGLLLIWMLNRLLLGRLQLLHHDVQLLSAHGAASAPPVRLSGRDEITELGGAINELLERVRHDAERQQRAHAEQEALQLQLAQSQKTEALGRLTGGIAHDFNNSLAAITGWVRLAAEDLDAEHPSHEALQQALKATRYADGLMRQLLAFGRQSAPKLRRLHWSSLIEETRQLMAPSLLRGCELVVDYRVDDDEVDADPTQLQQVMVNLFINAADAMQGRGRIELTLEALQLPDTSRPAPAPGTAALPEGPYLRLRVHDHGPGVPPELVDRVFDPFFSTKAKGRGTGLGLSVVHGIMARHGGAVSLQNAPGGGACFMLYLPPSPRDTSVPPLTAPGGWQGQGRALLFVDDDQSVRHAWSALLERKGWQVTRARDGEEGWAHFRQPGQRWDLVLTDQAMPRLDGVGLAQRIVATENPPPMVLMSGHVDAVDAGLLDRLFVAVLHKPVDAGELDRVLESVLARQDPNGSAGVSRSGAPPR